MPARLGLGGRGDSCGPGASCRGTVARGRARLPGERLTAGPEAVGATQAALGPRMHLDKYEQGSAAKENHFKFCHGKCMVLFQTISLKRHWHMFLMESQYLKINKPHGLLCRKCVLTKTSTRLWRPHGCADIYPRFGYLMAPGDGAILTSAPRPVLRPQSLRHCPVCRTKLGKCKQEQEGP